MNGADANGRPATARPLTIFAIPKPFEGHIGVIQRNAIRSWTMLKPPCEVILFGDELGTRAVAAEFGLRCVDDIERNEFGTPLLNGLFARAQKLAVSDLLCFVNSDMILMSDFMTAVNRVATQRRNFLLVGQRWGLDVGDALDFEGDWEERLRAEVRLRGRPQGVWAIDYFVFSRNLWGDIPPFAIGRPTYDNWLIYRARERRAAVVDVTPVVTAVHQNHDPVRMRGTDLAAAQGPETKRNLALAGETFRIFTLNDATHRLTPSGLRLPSERDQIVRRVQTEGLLAISRLFPADAVRRFVRLSRSLRGRAQPETAAGRADTKREK